MTVSAPQNSTQDNLTAKLIALIEPQVAPLGYEIVHLEVNHRQKTLRLFIDHAAGTQGISIEDCVKVTRALDEPLEQIPEIESAFGAGGYELEVSSPGIDRPLRTERDFEKFKGREIRVHTFRPLTAEEMGNPAYQAKNPKQKNFLGNLLGLHQGKVLVSLNLTGGRDLTQQKKKPSKKAVPSNLDAAASTNSVEVAIPLPLISKANLEPDMGPLGEGVDGT